MDDKEFLQRQGEATDGLEHERGGLCAGEASEGAGETQIEAPAFDEDAKEIKEKLDSPEETDAQKDGPSCLDEMCPEKESVLEAPSDAKGKANAFPYEYTDEYFSVPLKLSREQKKKLKRAQEIIGYRFKQERYLLSAITHPSATEGKPVKFSYERFEFLGDSILGAIVATVAFEKYHELDEGGLTRVKVALVAGSTLSNLAKDLGFSDVIVFGSSEAGTGRRGLHSALENVYEAVVAALFLDGGLEAAAEFVKKTLIPQMSLELATEPENPKSVLQEKLQEDGITPTYKLVETQGPPHDRRFVAQVYAGDQGLAQGSGRTKKEAESQAAKSTLARLGEFFGIGLTDEEREKKAAAEAQAKAEKAEAAKKAKAEKAAAKAARKKREKDSNAFRQQG